MENKYSSGCSYPLTPEGYEETKEQENLKFRSRGKSIAAMLGRELTQRYNKFIEKSHRFVTVATALAMMAFAAWQLWMQYFVTPGGGK